MDVADDIVDVAHIDRHPRVVGLHDGLFDLFRRGFQVDALDFGARNHDVLDAGFLQLEDSQQHLLVAVVDVLARLLDDALQLLVAERIALVDLRRHADQRQHAVGHHVDQPDQRVGQLQQRRVDESGGIGQFLRVQRPQRFRRHFGEDQQHQRQHAGGDGDAGVVEQPIADEGGQLGDDDVDEIVAEQDQADQPVGLLQQFPGAFRAGMALIRHVFEAVGVQRHQRRFGTGEECRQAEQRHKGAEENTQGDVTHIVISDLAKGWKRAEPRQGARMISSTILLPK